MYQIIQKTGLSGDYTRLRFEGSVAAGALRDAVATAADGVSTEELASFAPAAAFLRAVTDFVLSRSQATSSNALELAAATVAVLAYNADPSWMASLPGGSKAASVPCFTLFSMIISSVPFCGTNWQPRLVMRKRAVACRCDSEMRRLLRSYMVVLREDAQCVPSDVVSRTCSGSTHEQHHKHHCCTCWPRTCSGHVPVR